MRGKIDKLVSNVYQKQNMIDTLNWFSEIDEEYENLEDLTMGYFFGSLLSEAGQIAEWQKTLDSLKRRMKKYLTENNPQRKIRNIASKLTNEEQEEIKDILKKLVPQFREKIKKEIALLKIGSKR